MEFSIAIEIKGVKKKKLCIFIHYFPGDYYPDNVQYYLNELTLYFDEVRMVTNRREINKTPELMNHDIFIQFVENEGYDLGMFYKAFQEIDSSEYDQIACINDSNLIFNKLTTIFKWGKSANLDFWGLIDSFERPSFPTHQEDYHIQSHFIVFNEKAVELLPAFFQSINIDRIFMETDPIKLRDIVINHWEIGVSRFMIKNGLKIGSYFDSKIYSNLYISGKLRNISLRLYPQLIEAGYPLIKKKVILDRKVRNYVRFRLSWKKMIRQYGKKEWNIEDLVQEMIQVRNSSEDRFINKLKKQLIKVNILDWGSEK